MKRCECSVKQPAALVRTRFGVSSASAVWSTARGRETVHGALGRLEAVSHGEWRFISSLRPLPPSDCVLTCCCSLAMGLSVAVAAPRLSIREAAAAGAATDRDPPAHCSSFPVAMSHQVHKEGWLWKVGGSVQSWKRVRKKTQAETGTVGGRAILWRGSGARFSPTCDHALLDGCAAVGVEVDGAQAEVAALLQDRVGRTLGQ